MLAYPILKTLHIVSATLLFGTGLGTYFFMVQALRSGNTEALRTTAATVVRADWIFTTPAVLVQFGSGLLLMRQLHIPLTSVWFLTVLGLFVLIGLLWLPVVAIQIRLRHQLLALPPGGTPTPEFWRLARIWETLGYPAFAGVLVVIGLMVFRPWM